MWPGWTEASPCPLLHAGKARGRSSENSPSPQRAWPAPCSLPGPSPTGQRHHARSGRLHAGLKGSARAFSKTNALAMPGRSSWTLCTIKSCALATFIVQVIACVSERSSGVSRLLVVSGWAFDGWTFGGSLSPNAHGFNVRRSSGDP